MRQLPSESSSFSIGEYVNKSAQVGIFPDVKALALSSFSVGFVCCASTIPVMAQLTLVFLTGSTSIFTRDCTAWEASIEPVLLEEFGVGNFLNRLMLKISLW